MWDNSRSSCATRGDRSPALQTPNLLSVHMKKIRRPPQIHSSGSWQHHRPPHWHPLPSATVEDSHPQDVKAALAKLQVTSSFTFGLLQAASPTTPQLACRVLCSRKKTGHDFHNRFMFRFSPGMHAMRTMHVEASVLLPADLAPTQARPRSRPAFTSLNATPHFLPFTSRTQIRRSQLSRSEILTKKIRLHLCPASTISSRPQSLEVPNFTHTHPQQYQASLVPCDCRYSPHLTLSFLCLLTPPLKQTHHQPKQRKSPQPTTVHLQSTSNPVRPINPPSQPTSNLSSHQLKHTRSTPHQTKPTPTNQPKPTMSFSTETTTLSARPSGTYGCAIQARPSGTYGCILQARPSGTYGCVLQLQVYRQNSVKGQGCTIQARPSGTYGCELQAME